jgi:hypothetical protein
VIEAARGAVGDGAVSPERSEAAVAGFDEMFFAVHVENRVLLAGKRSVGQIFRSGRRAHGDLARAPHALAQPAVGIKNGVLDFGRQRRVQHESARFAASAIERLHVVVIEALHQLAQP